MPMPSVCELQGVEQEGGDRAWQGKIRQAEDGQKQPFTVQEGGCALLRTPSTMTESPQTVVRLMASIAMDGKGEHDQHAAEHRDEVQKNRHGPLGRQRPIGDIERADQRFEGTVDRI